MQQRLARNMYSILRTHHKNIIRAADTNFIHLLQSVFFGNDSVIGCKINIFDSIVSAGIIQSLPTCAVHASSVAPKSDKRINFSVGAKKLRSQLFLSNSNNASIRPILIEHTVSIFRIPAAPKSEVFIWEIINTSVPA